MARLESIGIGGYYPTPTHLLPLISSYLTFGGNPKSRTNLLDPCAGEGRAICKIAGELQVKYPDLTIRVGCIEMERTRFKRCKKRLEDSNYTGIEPMHADAFTTVLYERHNHYPKFDLVYLNPPYAQDKLFKRLEERFLCRFKDFLSVDGVMVFVVPHYTLSASAGTFGMYFRDVKAYCFPDADFATYKQVVVFARRVTPTVSDPAIVAACHQWAKDANSMPILGSDSGGDAPTWSMTAPDSSCYGNPSLLRNAADVSTLKGQFNLWTKTDRAGKAVPVEGVIPPGDIRKALIRRYPLAMPPKPGHIAQGIAAGVFNGMEVVPDPGFTGPNLLVKGVFSKEFVTESVKLDKEGTPKGEIQIQQPRLYVTVLDLTTKAFHTLRQDANVTGSTDPATMTTADLIQGYGGGLLKVLRTNCPVMHDPVTQDHEVTLVPSARPLFKAQADVAKALIKVLGGPDIPLAKRAGKSGYLLGELGSGKTSISLTIAETIGANKVLTMCPPHLLRSWENEIKTHTPRYAYMSLDSIEDVDAYAKHPGPIVGVMSREAAKLGFSWRDLQGKSCPKCGSPMSLVGGAKHRTRCQATGIYTVNDQGAFLMDFTRAISDASDAVEVHDLMGKHSVWKRTHGSAAQSTPGAEKRQLVSLESKHKVLASFFERYAERISADDINILGLFIACISFGDKAYAAQAIRKLALVVKPSYLNELLSGWGLFTMTASELKEVAESVDYQNDSHYKSSCLRDLNTLIQVEVGRASWHPYWSYNTKIDSVYHLKTSSNPKLALEALINALYVHLGKYVRDTAVCNEVLYQAEPPRRYPLAKYITKVHPDCFDLFLLDEGQEYANEDSAQSHAARRLRNLNKPWILLTGTLMNGYAASLFHNHYDIDSEFRGDFDREDKQIFIRRFGYLKQLVDYDNAGVTDVTKGVASDRVITGGGRIIGQHPGVLPLFSIRYLLKCAVILHKADLALNLPPRSDEVKTIKPTEAMMAKFNALRSELVRQIKEDQHTELSGKLFGQMAELPSFLDRCVASAENGGTYDITYPDGTLVTSQPLFDPDTVLPKEEWMLDECVSEVDKGRPVIVLTWHTELMPRYKALLAKKGLKVEILDAKKVSPAKRIDWVNTKVLAKGIQVLVVNPVCIQTGLNNLVSFATQLWMENPMANAIVARQAGGRIDRIGQKQPTRIVWAVYDEATQVNLNKLLLHKIGVSLSMDGLDAESALLAAGVGDQGTAFSMSVGRFIFNLLQED